MNNDSNNKFNNLVSQFDFENINEILYNWNESEISEDGTEILIYVDSRSNGPRTGGADRVDKKEFIDWLLSDAPFDEEVFGSEIREDEHWVGLIEKARVIVKS